MTPSRRATDPKRDPLTAEEEEDDDKVPSIRCPPEPPKEPGCQYVDCHLGIPILNCLQLATLPCAETSLAFGAISCALTLISALIDYLKGLPITRIIHSHILSIGCNHCPHYVGVNLCIMKICITSTTNKYRTPNEKK